VDAINGRLRNIHFHATAGQHHVAVTFVHRSFAESDERQRVVALEGGQERVQLVHALQIRGPLKVTGISDSPTRARVFLCHPAQTADEAACAHRIVENLARRAFRRPVTDADLQPLLAFYESGRRSGNDATHRPAGQWHLERCDARLAPVILPVEQHSG
jgi:hypothetical protein